MYICPFFIRGVPTSHNESKYNPDVPQIKFNIGKKVQSFAKERIIQVLSFSTQSLYPWTKLTRRNEGHLKIKLCTYINTLFYKIYQVLLEKGDY